MLRFDDFSGIRDAIEQAQTSILRASGMELAPDIVEISVRGPNVMDLTVIDLPGLVRSADKDENKSLVGDTAKLVDEYLRNERCIILAVVPANVDFHNSQPEILADAIKVDPKTCRTIPVITKPDLMGARSRSAVKDLLLGHKKDFRLGFHMIKCRGQKALSDGTGLAHSIERERRFFGAKSPWRKIEDRSAFGVEALREKLAALQVGMIEESLPSIIKEVAWKKALALGELEKLEKDLSTDAMRRECFNRFMEGAVRFITDTASGRGSYRLKESGSTWRSKLQSLFTEFATNILKQKLADICCVKTGQAVYVVDEAGNEVRGIVHQIGDRESMDVVYVDPVNDTQQISVFFEDEKERSKDKVYKVGEKLYYIDKRNPCIVRSIEDGSETVRVQDYRPFPLTSVYACHGWLQDKLAMSRTEDLSCFPSPTVFNSVVADMMRSDVEPLCFSLLDACHALLSTLIDAVPHADDQPEFEGHREKLRPLLQKRAEAAIADLHACARRRLRERLDAERLPFTSNHDLHDLISKKRAERLQRRLIAATAGLSNPGEVAPVKAGSGMSNPSTVAAAITAVFGQVKRRSCDEHAAMEMQVALEAYGRLASQRIIDDVPMLITAAMVAPLADGLRWAVCPTDAELRTLLGEAPEAAERRRRAEEQLRAMEAAEAAFDALSRRQFE
jgi:interferon-induced GTP-binding protein Mx1